MLLGGPPGCGKSTLARACAAECHAHVLPLHSGQDPHSTLAQDAPQLARSHTRVLVIIDEAEAICSSNAFIYALDTLVRARTHEGLPVAVVACASRPEHVSASAKRRGRFPVHAQVAPPSEDERLATLQLFLHKSSMSESLAIGTIAKRCRGFTGADLAELVRQAALEALQEANSSEKACESVVLHTHHFERAFRYINPSVVRPIVGETPQRRFSTIAGYEDTKHALTRNIVWPASMPEVFERLGIRKPSGVLLYGPPGTGKSSLAYAAIAEAQAVVIPLSCADVFAAGVGEGEAKLRAAFARAREAEHAVVLLDEVDGVGASRDAQHAGSSSSKLLATLLSEMDGLSTGRCNATILACTNREGCLDSALLRPGRLDVHVYVGPPAVDTREQLLRTSLADNMASVHALIGEDVSFHELARISEGMTGAELHAACIEAALSVRRCNAASVSHQHVADALRSVKEQHHMSMQQYESQ